MKKTEYEKRTAVYDIMNVSEQLRKKAENFASSGKTKTLNSGGKRYSGKRYTNSSEKLAALKKKYADGVPAGTIEQMLRINENG